MQIWDLVAGENLMNSSTKIGMGVFLRISQAVCSLWCPADNSMDDWSYLDNFKEPLFFTNKCHRMEEDACITEYRYYRPYQGEELPTSLADYRQNVTPTTRNALGIQTTPVLEDFPLFNLRCIEQNPVTHDLLITNCI
jgi:hypothetical protein